MINLKLRFKNKATLANNMITDSLTSVDDAVADDNISQEAVDQIKRQTRTEG